MSEAEASLPPAYFERLYTADPDPWRFASSPYEAAKYAATLAALPQERYHAALEIGCSIGVLTAQLAPRCEQLLALDVAEQALDAARERCTTQGQVTFCRAQVPHEFPSGRFDLILLSEVGYYLAWDDLARLQAGLLAALEPGGSLLLVHWTGPTNYPLTADEVHDSFLAIPALRHLQGSRAPEYRLDLFTLSSTAT